MIDFKWYFSVSENGENGLGDEGADGTMLPRIFGLEPLESHCRPFASNLEFQL